MTTLNTKIKFRNDLSTNWETLNPILLKGEPGYDTQKKIFKVGDGVTPWNTLESIAASIEESTPLFNYPYPGGGLIDGVNISDPRNTPVANTDIIWALGTNFGTTAFSNPVDGTRIIGTQSGGHLKSAPVSAITNRNNGGTNQDSELVISWGNPLWLRLRFGNNKKVTINKIALQQRTENSVLFRNLQINYSNDGINFINATNYTANSGPYSWSIFDVGSFFPSSYLEIKCTSDSLGGTYFIVAQLLLWGNIA